MAAEKLLSEAACKSAKATSTIYYLSDGAGLRMRIRPDASRTWIYRGGFKFEAQRALKIDETPLRVF